MSSNTPTESLSSSTAGKTVNPSTSSEKTWSQKIVRSLQLAYSMIFPWILRPILTGVMIAAGTSLYRWLLNVIFRTNYVHVEPHPIRHRQLLADAIQSETYCQLLGIPSGQTNNILGFDVASSVTESIYKFRMNAL